jgi:hypothetical protein
MKNIQTFKFLEVLWDDNQFQQIFGWVNTFCTLRKKQKMTYVNQWESFMECKSLLLDMRQVLAN